ncbi:hypothetical protein CCACVL1_18015 [Corchorus capsularis]|uniref:LRAT domain-containing protein n=1 Tax=Corchorus capsularis TaxID=210143 RepID=A0A1R3HNV1_COCAP|nr:hypothetical protein CCACVL1_18015 [Corchorus capsularis]
MVIHLMGPDGKGKGYSCTRPPCQKCGFEFKSSAGIFKTCMDCFLEGHSLYCCTYGVPSNWKTSLKNYRGLYSTSDSKPADEVVEMAHRVFKGEDKVFGQKYDLIENNCEHFAVYCKTGVPKSRQAALIRENPLYRTGKRIINKVRKKPNSVANEEY